MLSVICFSCNNHYTKHVAEKKRFKILFSNNPNPAVDAILEEKEIEKVIFVNSGRHLDPNRDKQLNLDVYTKFLEQAASKRSESEYVVLDWEWIYKDLFAKDINSERCKNAFLQLEKCLEHGRKILPNKKWGFYNLPICHYYDYEKWRTKNLRILDLLKKVDVFYPSLYDYYRDDNPYAGKKKDEVYIRKNLDVVFDLNKLLDKEIFVFVWHRWHYSNSIRPLYMIDLPEFRNHVAKIFAFKKFEKQVDGIVWWGSEQYFYNIKSKALVEEMKGYNDFSEYYENLVEKYLTVIIDEAKNKQIQN